MPDTIAAAPANPAGLGLVAFGLTTVLLSLVNAGVLPAGGEPVVIPLALSFGGLMQIIAGVMEFRPSNTFGATAFCASASPSTKTLSSAPCTSRTDAAPVMTTVSKAPGA